VSQVLASLDRLLAQLPFEIRYQPNGDIGFFDLGQPEGTLPIAFIDKEP
jgi:hypothetical protein